MERCTMSDGHDLRLWELDGRFWIHCLYCWEAPNFWVGAMGRILPRRGIIRLDPSAPKRPSGFWDLDRQGWIGWVAQVETAIGEDSG